MTRRPPRPLMTSMAKISTGAHSPSMKPGPNPNAGADSAPAVAEDLGANGEAAVVAADEADRAADRSLPVNPAGKCSSLAEARYSLPDLNPSTRDFEYLAGSHKRFLVRTQFLPASLPAIGLRVTSAHPTRLQFPQACVLWFPARDGRQTQRLQHTRRHKSRMKTWCPRRRQG